MRYLLSVILSLFTIFCLPVFSQSTDHHMLIEELIEELTLVHIPDMDPDIIYEDLLYYLQNPLDINTAGADDLRRLWLLNELQIENLIRYRQELGGLVTIYELQYIDGFSQDDVRKVIPFIAVDPVRLLVAVPGASILRYGRHQLFVRAQQVLQEQRGYSPVSESALAANPNSRYLGSPLKLYHRYQFSYQNRVQAGYVAEKDAGEEFFRGSNRRGFDFYTLHLQVNDIGRLKTVALGDFQAGFGQGLVLWSGLAFGKSSAVLNIRKNPRGIQKYSSVDENMFFRGAGLTYRLFEGLESSLFVSRKKIDAGVSATNDEGNIMEVSSLRNTGLHATPSQVEGRNVLGETIIGGNLTFNRPLFKLGATFTALEYDAVLNPPERIYNQFDFRGSRNANIGIDYQFSAGAVKFFGEGAVSSSRGTALLGGALANLGSMVSMSALYRSYDRDYHAYFSNGFRENTRTSNEEGLYIGLLIHPLRQWKLSAYVDFFSFPWMRYGAWAPSAGNEYFLQLDYNRSRNMHMYLNFRQKNKPENAPPGAAPVRDLFDAGISRLRYHISYFITPALELRNRVELSQYVREDIFPERGILLYQDILFRPAALPLSAAFRFAVFRTDSYNARLYAYENDVLYAFSIPAYYDRGYRTYLLLQYAAGEMMDIWMRIAHTRLPGRESIGSGLNGITGDAHSDIKIQLRLRFR